MQFRFIVAASLVALSLTAAAQMPDKVVPRPRITGISHIAVYSSDLVATEHYYVDIIGAVRVADPEDTGGARYLINATQFVEVLPLPAGQGINHLAPQAVRQGLQGRRSRRILSAGGQRHHDNPPSPCNCFRGSAQQLHSNETED